MIKQGCCVIFVFLILFNHFVSLWLYRPMRGGEKLEIPQPMLAGLQREQQRPPPHLHPPPPHRAWEQLGQLYESHLPPQGHPVVPLPNEHSLRLHNGGYAGSSGPPPNPHHPPSRPNHVLKVSHNATSDFMADLCTRVKRHPNRCHRRNKLLCCLF